MSLLVLFAWSFAAATILPIGSEVSFAVVVHESRAWLVPVVVPPAGTRLGPCTSYPLGRAAARVVQPEWWRVVVAAGLLRRYAPLAVLLSWVPLAGDVLVALAGAA